MQSRQDQPIKDDTDDILAAIMGGAAPAAPSVISHKQSVASTARQKDNQKQTVSNTRPKRKNAHKPLGAFIAIFFILGVVLAAGAGAFLYRERITAFLAPPSPFSSEVRASLSFPVYYPTEMPGTFKLDTDTITQPDSNVVVYRLTNDEGIAVTISQQAANNQIDIRKLYPEDQEPKQVELPLGTAHIGTVEGSLLAHLVGQKTWIIVTTSPSTLSSDELEIILRSMRQG